MENQDQPKRKLSVKNFAIFGLLAICAWSLSYYTQINDGEEYPFKHSIAYKLEDGAPPIAATPCKVLGTKVTITEDSMSFLFSPPNASANEVMYLIEGKTEIKGVGTQYFLKSPTGVATITLVHDGDAVVAVEGPYLLIFSNGNTCLEFKDLPIPN